MEGSPLRWLVNFKLKLKILDNIIHIHICAMIEKFSEGFIEGLAERSDSRLLSS